jgi:hypothetical protein
LDSENPNVYPFLFTLWLFNVAMEKWPIEIDGLPIKNGDFP